MKATILHIEGPYSRCECGAPKDPRSQKCRVCWCPQAKPRSLADAVRARKKRQAARQNQQRAETMRAHWLEPDYRTHMLGSLQAGFAKRADHWSSEQDAALREMAGKLTTREISQELSRRFEHPRTEWAVRHRLFDLGLSIGVQAYTLLAVARIFGRHHPRGTRDWIDAGLLEGEAMRPESPRSHFVIRREAVERFIREHPEAYDPSGITDRSLRALAEVVHRSDPLLNIKEVSKIVRVPCRTLYQHAAEGKLQALRGSRRNGKKGSPPWLVRRSELLRYQAARDQKKG